MPLLAECDFGEFENKNYKELSDNPHYQEWIDSNGTLPFPGGESKEECADRNLKGFDEVLKACRDEGITEQHWWSMGHDHEYHGSVCPSEESFL